MRFSVIIPIYNVEKYLKDCLDSILNQTSDDWEAICVNDGSTDSSVTIVEGFAAKDQRFKMITQPNAGLSSARNSGLKVAQGDYVLFLDSDDWLELNALEVLSGNMDREDMLCFSGRRYFEETNLYNPADVLREKSYASGMDYYNENALLHRDFAFVCVVLRAYRREFLLSNNLFFKEGIFHEDNLFTPIACCFARKVKVINECLYVYRVRINSITTTVNRKRYEDLMGTANQLSSIFVSQSGFDKTTVYRAITNYYQVIFASLSKNDLTIMRGLCDWKLYRKVSRTKLRHRWNFFKNKYGL